MSSILQWLESREPRERLLLLISTGVLLFLIAYSAVWEPLKSAYSDSQSTLKKLKHDLVWMRKAQLEIKALRPNQTSTSRDSSGQSLQTLINQSTRAQQLDKVIKYTIPRGQNKYQLRMEDARFTHLISWLSLLRQQHGIYVYAIDINRASKSGLVNTNITVNRVKP